MFLAGNDADEDLLEGEPDLVKLEKLPAAARDEPHELPTHVAAARRLDDEAGSAVAGAERLDRGYAGKGLQG